MSTINSNLAVSAPAPIKTSPTEKRNRWVKHLKQWAASGQTQQDYCHQHQLKLHQLVYWKRVLSGQPKNKKIDSAANGFIAVQLTQPLPATEHLTLELPSGIRIKGIQANNLHVIQEIIRWQS